MSKPVYILFILFIFLVCTHTVLGQEKYTIVIPFANKYEKKQLHYINKNFSDTAAKKKIYTLIEQRNQQGFYGFTQDTANHKITIRFFSPLIINQIKIEGGVLAINESINYFLKKSNHLSFTQKRFNIIKEEVLKGYQNKGYPFVQFSADSSLILNKQINLQFGITQGPLITYDSVIVKGNAKINKVYLYKYNNIAPNKIYSEKDVALLPTHLNEINFVQSIKKPDVVFIKDKARIIYYLDKKNANQFDGFAGFLPDNVTGKINITGQAKIQLVNSFGLGEQLSADWRKLQPLTQDLKLGVSMPYIAGTMLGVEDQFKLYKRDTTFIDITNFSGLQFFLNQQNIFKVTLSTRNSSLLTPAMYKNAIALPEVADIKSMLYGIGLKTELLDYKLNPRKGYSLQVNAQTGNRKIIKNTALNSQLYNGLQLSTNQYSGALNSIFYIPLFKKSTIAVGCHAGSIYGITLFKNELYRLGGLNSLRGFDEESINASSYCITSAEYRILFEKNSNLYFFFNNAWYENNSLQKYKKDYPFGFGTGISFQTKAGIFTINYALGKQLNNPIMLRSAKIHFGLVNYF